MDAVSRYTSPFPGLCGLDCQNVVGCQPYVLRSDTDVREHRPRTDMSKGESVAPRGLAKDMVVGAIQVAVVHL